MMEIIAKKKKSRRALALGEGSPPLNNPHCFLVNTNNGECEVFSMIQFSLSLTFVGSM